jgi:hypothetical protein
MLRVSSIVLALALVGTLDPGDGWAASRRRRPNPSATRRHKKSRQSSARQPALAVASASASSPQVVYATAQHAYLNRGKAEGLVRGASLSLTRRDQNIASCVIDSVADHTASCAGKGIQPGDRFVASAKKSDDKSLTIARSPLPSAAELDRRLAVVASAPHQQVSFEGASGGTGGAFLPAQARLGFTSWFSVNTPDSSFREAWLAVAVRGAPIGAGLRLFVDALAVHWIHRASTYRFPIQSPNQLFVYQLEVASRDPGTSLVFSAGRIWPFHAPGVGTVDGAQLGWRSRKGDFEVGVLGGAIPDPVTLSPETLRPVVGVYAAAEQTSITGELRLAREELRVSLSRRPDLGWRGEAESSVIGYWGRSFDLAGDLRLGMGQDNASSLLEVAQLSTGIHPSEQFHLYAAGRYLAAPPAEVLNPGDLLVGDRSVHADGSIAYLPWRWLSLAANVGHAGDLKTGLARTFGGPELGFPRLFGTRGGALLGYQQEIGQLRGKTAYLQLVASPFNGFRLLERVSWFENLPEGASAPNYEAGFYSSLDWMFAPWVGLRGSVLGRFSLDAVNTADPTAARPYGFIVSANINGQF